MDSTHIAGLMSIFERSSLTELDYAENGSRLRLRRAATTTTPTSTPGESSTDHPRMVAHQTEPARVKDPAGENTNRSNDRRITAGLTGAFFRRPSPEEPPFVSVGDMVKAGQVLGIIEAMKMLNPIESDCDGQIVSIEVEDGASVDTGTVLFIVQAMESNV